MFSHQTAKLHLFLLFLVSAVLGLASIYSLVLKCAALDARKANVNRFYLAPDSSHPYTIAVNNTIPLFPVHLNDEATPPVIATAALSLALSLAGLCFSYTSLTKGPFLISALQRLCILATLLIHYLLTLTSLICAFVIHSLSGHYDAGYLAPRYDRGIFDPETWACEMPLSNNLRGRDAAILQRQCSFEQSSRWVSVCIFILSTIFGTVMVIVLCAEHELPTSDYRKSLEAHSEYDYDSPSVYSR